MNENIHKYLCKKLGVHYLATINNDGPHGFSIVIRDETAVARFVKISAADFFFMVWDWSVENNILETMKPGIFNECGDHRFYSFNTKFINPSNFITSVHDFLVEQESE